MSLVTQPITLTVGEATQVKLPQYAAQVDAVVMANLSSLLLVVNIGADVYYQSPWSEAHYPIESNDQISVTPYNTSGTAPPGAAAQLNCTWYVTGEQALGTWPVSLTANALAASISGGTVTLAGDVPVVNGIPSPLQVGGVLETFPELAVISPRTNQVNVVVTGTPEQLPTTPVQVQGVWVRALKANVGPVIYLGGNTVTASSGLELLPGEIFGPILVSNANLLWINGTAGDGVSFLAN